MIGRRTSAEEDGRPGRLLHRFVLFVFVGLAIIRVLEPQWLDLLFESRWGFLSIIAVGAVGLAAYIIDVWRNPRMPPDKRALWTVVFLALNWYAMPFYFWFYVRPIKD